MRYGVSAIFFLEHCCPSPCTIVIKIRAMKEKKNEVEPAGDYGMWYVGGVPHRGLDRGERTISLMQRVFPLPWQHSFRDAGGSGHVFHSTAIVKGISLALADPKLGECVVYIYIYLWDCSEGNCIYRGMNELRVVRVIDTLLRN